MDLSQIKPDTRTIEIKHPATGQPIGVRVGIMSMNDERLIPLKRQIADARLDLEKRRKHFKAEEIERNALKLLFTATTGWEWYNPTGSEGDDGYDAEAMPSFEGEVPAFNERNFKRIAAALPWFANQISEEIEEEKAFFVNSNPS